MNVEAEDPEAVIRYAVAGDIPVIRKLALEIWPQAYAGILSEEQMNYMLEQMYSLSALGGQLASGVIFLIADINNKPSGFAAYCSTGNSALFRIHKLYVLPGIQKKGLGKLMLGFIINEARAQGGRLLQLNVNRMNKAKSFYEKQGFTATSEEDIDIGNGYYMNDYVMEKPV